MENGVGIWEGAAAARAPSERLPRGRQHTPGLRAALGGGRRRRSRRRLTPWRSAAGGRASTRRCTASSARRSPPRRAAGGTSGAAPEARGREILRRAEQVAAGGRAVARADLLVEVDREAVLARGAAPPLERRAPRRRRRRLECDGVGGARVDAVGAAGRRPKCAASNRTSPSTPTGPAARGEGEGWEGGGGGRGRRAARRTSALHVASNLSKMWSFSYRSVAGAQVLVHL